MHVRPSVLGNIGMIQIQNETTSILALNNLHLQQNSGCILTDMVHNILTTELEPPTLKLRLVLDAGPGEGAISFLGVDATSLNVENPDDVAG